MSDPNSSSDILSYVLTACVGGIAWLFKTVFDHNKEMVNQIVLLQRDTIKTQTLTRDALIQTHSTLEALKAELTDNTDIQRDILGAIKAQPIYSDPRKIIVSHGATADGVTAKKGATTVRKRNSNQQLQRKNADVEAV